MMMPGVNAEMHFLASVDLLVDLFRFIRFIRLESIDHLAVFLGESIALQKQCIIKQLEKFIIIMRIIYHKQTRGEQSFTLELLDGLSGTTPPFDFKLCSLSDSLICTMTYMVKRADFSHSTLPASASSIRTVRVSSDLGTVCQIDIEERKG